MSKLNQSNVDLLCILSEYYPKGVKVTWTQGSQDLTSSSDTKELKSAENGFTQISVLKLDRRNWQNGLIYTCSITHETKSFSANISICSEYPIPSPSVYLEKPTKGPDNKMVAICNVVGPHGTKMVWLLDEIEIDNRNSDKSSNNLVNGTESITDKFSRSSEEWESIKKITCRAQHPCSNNIEQSLSLTGVMSREPTVKLFEFSDKEDSGSMTLVCRGSGFNPRVTWQESTGKQMDSINMTVVQQGEWTTVSSETKVNMDKWKKGDSFTCEVTDQPFGKKVYKKISICTEYPIPSPSVYLEKPTKGPDNKMVAICNVVGPHGTKMVWLLDEIEIDNRNSDKSSNNLVNGTESITDKFSRSSEEWESIKKITCRAQHPCSNNIEQSLSLTGVMSREPTVKLFEFSDKEDSGSMTLVCRGSGFNPRVTWQESTGKQMDSINMTVVQQGEWTTVSSETKVNMDKWKKGDSFTCEVTDQPFGKKVNKKISICTEIPESSRKATVALLGPSLEEKLASSDFNVTCQVEANNPLEFSITWMVNNRDVSVQPKAVQPKDNSGHLQSTFTVKWSDWEECRPVSCHVKHICSNSAQNVSLKRTEQQNVRRPTLQLFRPSDVKPAKTGQATLLCLILDFFPDDIKAHWEINGTRVNPSQYSNTHVMRLDNASSYSMHSKLLIPQWQKGDYSCVVQHESSQHPLTSTITDVFPSTNSSTPKVKLFRSSDGLLCLVYGFSPAAINITWLLNRKDELTEYNTTAPSRSPDGKFIIQSELRLSSASWITKAIYTCKVEHVTKTAQVHISDPQSINDEILDTISEDLGLQDNTMEIWTAACTFLALFLISFVYSSFVTFAKMK